MGENLAAGKPYDFVDIKTLITAWENEKKDYRHPAYPNSVQGHYTQIVNKNVTEIGCACSKCDNLGRYCVCRYKPGQIGNQYPY
jgi:pathogenesis-related protein 1